MKIILSILMVVGFINFSNAQDVKTSVIKTSAECGSCKKRIEEKLNYTKGVKFAELDVPTKELTVKYSTKKMSLDKIRTILSELGYDADEVKAVPEAVKKLPACCQPGGMKNKK